MSEHKAGETVVFPIGDKQLIVEPIPFGKLKKVIQIVADVSKTFDAKTVQEDLLTIVPKVVEGYVSDFVPLLFDPVKHPFLTPEWIDDHLTIPVIKQIIVAAIAVNGLGDFFVKTVKAPAPKAVDPESGTRQTPSESTGSTTSSDSPRDGGPKT